VKWVKSQHIMVKNWARFGESKIPEYREAAKEGGMRGVGWRGREAQDYEVRMQRRGEMKRKIMSESERVRERERGVENQRHKRRGGGDRRIWR
jgi:hypothetical protein